MNDLQFPGHLLRPPVAASGESTLPASVVPSDPPLPASPAVSMPPSARRGCPCCGGALRRIPRHPLDRVLNYFVPVHRYSCHKFGCQWTGLLFHPEDHQVRLYYYHGSSAKGSEIQRREA